MENSLDEIKEKLHSSNYKLTPQREATVRVLLEHADDHLSAEDVYMFVKKNTPVIGLATVYRTLELLNELGIVNKVNFGDGIYRFDLCIAGARKFHYHLVCVRCRNVTEVKEDLLEKVEKQVETCYKFKVNDHRLIFHGLCINCQNG